LCWAPSTETLAGSRGPSHLWLDPKVLLPAFWTPLLGFIKDRPSASVISSVHSQMNRSPPFGSKMPISEHVPSLPFLPTPTVYSTQHPAGLLHPATGHGVRHVSSLLPARRPKALNLKRAFPSGASPYEAFPSMTAWNASPRTVPSHRCSWLPAVSPPVLPRLGPRPSTDHSASGLCSITKSVANPPALPPTDRPMLPWAWSPPGFSMPDPTRLSEEGRSARSVVVRRPRRNLPGIRRVISPPKRRESAPPVRRLSTEAKGVSTACGLA
jgi:hypothetical protein